MEHTTPLTFSLKGTQVTKFNQWKKRLKAKHGKYGLLTFEFTPTGVGTTVIVRSNLTKDCVDLSETEKW